MANYVLLERIELNAVTASVTFSNIPQTGYTDLKIVVSSRSSDTGIVGNALLWFNGDNSLFSYKRIYGDGTATGSSGASSANINLLHNGAGSTANTFSSSELYIPNYASTSTYKSWSIDSVQETNATEAYSYLVAGLWSSTSAINSITIAPWAGLGLLQYSSFSLYGIADVNTTPAIAPKASGGNITTDGTYWIHTFNSTGSFVPAVSLTCDYLVIAGGGGGGDGGGGGGGGGGAGGFRTSIGGSALSLTATSYTVTVGAGGVGATSYLARGSSGSNSVFSTITSTGGGGGGSYDTIASGLSGGSGGGGGGNTVGGSGGSASPSGQGNAGGSGVATSGVTLGGGGGGAGGAGANAVYSGSLAGAGGSGLASSISGSSVTYAGGGGGATGGGGGTRGAGGSGGGGNGQQRQSSYIASSSGTANTGGGGGGIADPSLSGSTWAGGSGVVIIRYTIA